MWNFGNRWQFVALQLFPLVFFFFFFTFSFLIRFNLLVNQFYLLKYFLMCLLSVCVCVFIFRKEKIIIEVRDADVCDVRPK